MRIRESAAEKTRKETKPRLIYSAVRQKYTKAKPAESRRASVKPDIPSKRSAKSSQVQREEPRSGATPLSESHSRNKKSTRETALAPIETFGAQNKSKSNTRARRSRGRKFNPSTPTHSIGHNKKGTIQLGQSSLLGEIEQPLNKNPRSPAQSPSTRQALSKEALEAHTRITELADANWDHLDAKEYARYPSNQNMVVTQTPDGSYIDPQEAFNRKWGYLPPFDEESEKVIAFLIDNPTLAKTMARTQPGTWKFGVGLDDRNVALKPSKDLDKCKADIESLDIQGFMNEPVNEEESHELLWKFDQAKITVTSSEALFQRTIMVSLIARHFLIYQRDSHENQLFEFSVEEAWTCLPMPSRALNGTKEPIALGQEVVAPEHRFLTQPKPDLAVAFNREAIIPDETWETLPRTIRTLASFEKVDPSNLNVFHFLVIEAKNPASPIEDRKALHQCSNCASQALFNFFEFFRDAGTRHENLFFEKVRFFSVVANRTGLIVRIHRAIEVPKDSIARRVIPRDPSYLLKFQFQDFARIEGVDNFGRGKVLNIFRKIFKYAKDTLRPLIENATSDVSKKLNTDIGFFESRSLPDVYRHGQPGIESSRDSQRSTPASSAKGTRMDFLQRRIQGVPLSSNGASSAGDERMRSGQTTPKPLNNKPRIPSKLGPEGKKRKASQGEEEDLDCSESEKPTISKRQRAKVSYSVSSSQTSRMASDGA